MSGVRRVSIAGVAVAAAITLASGGPAGADEAVDAVKDFGGGARYNAGYAIFVAKDLGGGAYWLSTTTAQDGLESSADAGRDGLLTINETVIVPIEDAISGG